MVAPERAPSVHAFILCWPGWETAARHIAGALAGFADHLTVLYKNDTGVGETGPGDWRRIPSECFYGWQFQHTLGLNRGDVMLHVQADTHCHDWTLLVARCRDAFRTRPDLGVWSPDVYHSFFTPGGISVGQPREDGTVAVTATDGIVWALSSEILPPLRELDYFCNNIGWGTNGAAAAVAVTMNRSVAMDLAIKVAHPEGSSYDRRKAHPQWDAFMRQLSPAQQAYAEAATALVLARRGRKITRIMKLSILKEWLRGCGQRREVPWPDSRGVNDDRLVTRAGDATRSALGRPLPASSSD